MLKIAYHPRYVQPLPEGHRFPMLKYELIPGQLLHEGLINSTNLFEPEFVNEDIICLTHDKNYWHRLRGLKLTPQEVRRLGFPLSPELIDREICIAGGTIQGCLFAMKTGVAFNVAGGTHHAGFNWGEGFCMLNDQAIAANFLLKNNLASRILIIDLDVHQGNGTAQIFKNDARVFTFSMHGEKNFPFRKEVSDLDIGLPDSTGDIEYLNILRENIDHLFDTFKPEFVFYLSGVDILQTDALGKLSVSIAGCKERDYIVLKHCFKYGIPVQVSMGGGYSPKIQDIVDAHCNTYRVAFDLYN